MAPVATTKIWEIDLENHKQQSKHTKTTNEINMNYCSHLLRYVERQHADECRCCWLARSSEEAHGSQWNEWSHASDALLSLTIE